MGWNDEETMNQNKGMRTSSKVLIAIMVFIILIIALLIFLLMNLQEETDFKIYVNEQINTTVKKETLITTINNVTYINIEEFAKLVNYEYHNGEYKSSIIDKHKCYVEGELETATFYLNVNTIYKLLVNNQEEPYQEYKVENTVKIMNNKMYASIEAISKAFNVLVSEREGDLRIFTLDYLINIYDSNVIKWGYTSIKDQSFENKKALLYGCLIVKKEGGSYKVIDVNNTKEILLARYKKIEFSENTQEFVVTDNLNKVGITNIDGTMKIEPIYDSISMLDKELYIVELNKKFGVVSKKGNSIIYPEYDSIGIKEDDLVENKYILLNELIPVYKNEKWGAFNKSGDLVLNVEYEQIGYLLNVIEINGIKQVVKPAIEIRSANAVVVRKNNKYGLFDIEGKELFSVVTDGIYEKNGVEDSNSKYFMLYNGKELNVIEELGLTEEENIQKPGNITNEITNTITNTITNNIN